MGKKSFGTYKEKDAYILKHTGFQLSTIIFSLVVANSNSKIIEDHIQSLTSLPLCSIFLSAPYTKVQQTARSQMYFYVSLIFCIPRKFYLNFLTFCLLENLI